MAYVGSPRVIILCSKVMFSVKASNNNLSGETVRSPL